MHGEQGKEHYGDGMFDRPTTQATFPSRCLVCDETILEGDYITLVNGSGFPGDDVWIHTNCVEDFDDRMA